MQTMTSEPIAVGQPAPDFTLAASTGPSPLSLAELRGQIVVLAFYVLDFTST
jgi:peroxiredoxin